VTDLATVHVEKAELPLANIRRQLNSGNIMSYQALLKSGLQLAAAILLGTVTVVSGAEEQGKATKDARQADKRATVRLAVNYRPPLRDDSRVMAGAGSRTADGKTARLEALVPDHVGLTTNAQPVLYWYASTPVDVNVEISLVNKGEAASLLMTVVDSRNVAGIHQLDLSDHKISLQPEVLYQWSVAAVSGEGGHPENIVASGIIEHMEPGEGLRNRIRKVRGIALVEVYAYEGLWYDALESISSMIEESPEDRNLVAIRASLLDQAGLQTSGQVGFTRRAHEPEGCNPSCL
jgi:hypothetical protein